MKHYVRLLFVIAALLLVGALCVSCGNQPAETLVDEGDMTEVPEIQAHEHISTSTPTVVEATCTAAGYSEYLCDDCGETYRVEENITVGHTFDKTVTDRKTGMKKATCTRCGAAVNPLIDKDSMTFEATCKGDITIEFEVTGADAEVEFFLDDFSMYKKTYKPGKHTATIARGLDESDYIFTLAQNNEGSTVAISNITVDGKIARKNPVILEIDKQKDAKRGSYENFYVYVKTSDPSGKYYVRYNFIYEYNTNIVLKSNTTDNIDAFRVKEAYLVEITSVTDTDVKYNLVQKVLQQGEISLAARESRDGVADFIGGYHGDDHMFEFVLKADGAEYKPGEGDIAVVCDTVEFTQRAYITRCGAPDTNVMIHNQQYTIDGEGVKIAKSLEWLVDDFKSTTVYMQMFTVYRNDVCENLMVLDGEGKNPFSGEGDNILLATDVKVIEEASKYADKRVLSSKDNRQLVYSSDKTGISARVGFEILNESCSIRSASIQLRYKDAKDNKWYVDFTGPNGNATPKKGDVWAIDSYYDIDYVAPAK